MRLTHAYVRRNNRDSHAFSQAFVLDVPGSGGNTAADAHTSPELSRGKVDMAALWLRLRRAAIEPSSRHHCNDDEAQRPIPVSAVGTNGGGGEGRAEDHEVMLGERESWSALTWEGPVDVSSLGRERFEECDTEGSGSVPCHTFREVSNPATLERWSWREAARQLVALF